MLRIENIRKTFNPRTINEKVALNGVDLVLNDGEFVTVIGSNGAGKSTLLNAIAGVWLVDEGKIGLRPAVELSYIDDGHGCRHVDRRKSCLSS